MNKILILGSNAREMVLAEKLLKSNTVYIMSEKKNPNELLMDVVHINAFFDEDIVKQINPHLVFAFSDEYVFNKNINDKVHEICNNAFVIIPKTNHYVFEKNKNYVRKMFFEQYLTKVNSKSELEKN